MNLKFTGLWQPRTKNKYAAVGFTLLCLPTSASPSKHRYAFQSAAQSKENWEGCGVVLKRLVDELRKLYKNKITLSN